MNKFFPLVILTTLFFLSCSNLKDGDEVLYLKTGNSYLPIYVRGNRNASTYIIWTHGGPGSSGMYYGDIDEIKVLHRDYRVVYWDQMGSGASTGNPSKDDYNIDEFSLHQDGVVNIIQNRYHPDRLFLLGHSWGGFLASYYLIANGNSSLAAQRQSQFNGVILLNPVLDIGRSIREGIAYIREDYAPAQIAAGQDVAKWTVALSWYEQNLQNGLLYGGDVSRHYQYIEDAGGMLVQRDRNDELTKQLGPQMIFFSPFHFYDYYNNQNTIRTYLDIAERSLARPGEPNLSSLTVPTLFIAGENDKIASIEMSREWFALMGFHTGTPAEWSEYFKQYENCAHAAFLDAPQQFQENVITFMGNH